MKKFILVQDNEIVYKYESESQQVFGGPWGEATQLELPEGEDLDTIEVDFDSLTISPKQEKNQILANKVLEEIRAKRDSLLVEADILVNIALDSNLESLNDCKNYRISLRTFTEQFKELDGQAKLTTRNVIVDELEFPQKPILGE